MKKRWVYRKGKNGCFTSKGKGESEEGRQRSLRSIGKEKTRRIKKRARKWWKERHWIEKELNCEHLQDCNDSLSALIIERGGKIVWKGLQKQKRGAGNQGKHRRPGSNPLKPASRPYPVKSKKKGESKRPT